jgi:hypothetical protein
LHRNRIHAQPASPGIFLFHCIAMLVLAFAAPITMILVTLGWCRGINAIAAGGRPQMPQAVARY